MDPPPILVDLDGADVRPETVDARASLGLVVALIEAIEAVGRYEEGTEEPPFTVVLTEMRGASVHFGLRGVSKEEYGARGLESFQTATARIPVYLRANGVIPKRLAPPLEKVRSATRGLHPKIVATVRFGPDAIVLSEVVRAPAAPLLKTTETFRAFILRAGGVHPRVSLRFRPQTKPVTLDCDKALIEAADFKLYREADVSGVFFRDVNAIGAPIVSGRITALRVVLPVDPVVAFDAWYEAAGRPWAGVTDIEEELRNRGRE